MAPFYVRVSASKWLPFACVFPLTKGNSSTSNSTTYSENTGSNPVPARTIDDLESEAEYNKELLWEVDIALGVSWNQVDQVNFLEIMQINYLRAKNRVKETTLFSHDLAKSRLKMA